MSGITLLGKWCFPRAVNYSKSFTLRLGSCEITRGLVCTDEKYHNMLSEALCPVLWPHCRRTRCSVFISSAAFVLRRCFLQHGRTRPSAVGWVFFQFLSWGWKLSGWLGASAEVNVFISIPETLLHLIPRSRVAESPLEENRAEDNPYDYRRLLRKTSQRRRLIQQF